MEPGPDSVPGNDRLLILEHGHAIQEGPLDDILAAPSTPFARAVATSR